MPDLFISGISKPLLNKFRNRINMMRDGGAKKGDLSTYAIEAIKTWIGIQDKTVVTIEPGHAQEVFEILCGIPFDIATSQDNEPPNRRHPAIEAMIQQLKDRIEKEE